ncbi:MAG: D-alanyl-D-alanine carboxypeptidase [Desulfobacterales bacterium]|nr:D-alanyl-D-alanine carboxypeptidase [Desulfobacterales bacterium]MBL7102320.1 D-alanyl-D-alanine carboxypeptidase [Desulfobacteraceae bacterium]MBL7173467.1 D-alanyl-D-alanine carboxypeptidase [Desulfobacteraceae bacterium]MBU0988779.1 D-alanyl-D-alanine carboxypeptidase [Pseudomonadota bacterium]
MNPIFTLLLDAYLTRAPDHPFARTFKKTARMTLLATVLAGCFSLQPFISDAKQLPCLANIKSQDALLVAGADGRILYKKNETKNHVPASTLKVLTALAALNHFGPSYRFRTEFYTDTFHNLKVKAYGDPLLISEVLREVADVLSKKIQGFQNLILDNTYFDAQIEIPGCGESTNPYDAPVGAFCANFNTVFFRRDAKGRIISSERQTPVVPFARERIRSLGLKSGRYAFLRDSQDAARYAGELLLYFLRKKGVKTQGDIRFGAVVPGDMLIYTYESTFALETVLEKMLKSSSNFIANQILISLGASVSGPPGTLAKGVDAVTDFARNDLHLEGVKIVEGSGISRQNRLSALHMLTILERFKPYRHLLKRENNVSYKTGSLEGVRTRVGYVEDDLRGLYYFVIFLNQNHSKMDGTMNCIKKAVAR